LDARMSNVGTFFSLVCNASPASIILSIVSPIYPRPCWVNEHLFCHLQSLLVLPFEWWSIEGRMHVGMDEPRDRWRCRIV
jgi:hypothetical protein